MFGVILFANKFVLCKGKYIIIPFRRKVSIKGAKDSRYYSHLYITIVTNPLPVFYSKFSVTKLQCDETSVNHN